jgi:HAD superfamily hydrolase (TIGR01509 family)
MRSPEAVGERTRGLSEYTFFVNRRSVSKGVHWDALKSNKVQLPGNAFRSMPVIFFDVGNTLLFPEWDEILAPLSRYGRVPPIEQLRELERKTKQRFDSMMATESKTNIGFWRMFHSSLLAELEISDPELLDTLARSMANSRNWIRSRPGTRETLNSIAKSYRTGVISNADGKIAGVLQECGLADCFLTITDSGIVGYEKPHAAIFEAACREMKASPDDCLYVGDVYSVDYVGAKRAGMNAILFDVSGAYKERDLARVESLQELESWLSAGGIIEA